MYKILVTGNSGAGKSTFAQELSESFDIPLIHMDIHYWQPNWTRPEEEEWRTKVTELAKKDQWVMEGNFADTLDIRLSHATHLIHLDFPAMKCLYRCIKRRIVTGKDTRPDLPKECKERIDLTFYKFVLAYPSKHSYKVYDAAKKFCKVKFLVAKSDPDLKKIMAEIKNYEA